jgi:predicted RNA-binding Zn ribbon-like protein
VSDKKSAVNSLKLLGGRLCLDFVNTQGWRGKEDPGEYLNTYDELIAWSSHVDMISKQEVRALSQKSDKHHLAAESALNHAIELRETIFRIFSSIAEGNSAANKDLTVFNKYLSRTMRLSQIIKKKNGFYWDTTGDKAKLEWILNPIIRSTADLMISQELRKVKKCGDPVCGWLFLDISRNQRRRWCDMQDCGNRAKASRFYQKKQISKKGTGHY